MILERRSGWPSTLCRAIGSSQAQAEGFVVDRDRGSAFDARLNGASSFSAREIDASKQSPSPAHSFNISSRPMRSLDFDYGVLSVLPCGVVA